MAVNVVLKSVFDDKGIKAAQNEFGKIGKTLGAAFAAVGAATAAAAAGLIKFGSDSIAAAENVAQANNRLGQVAKSMGIFGAQTDQVTDRLIKFAEANELTVAVDAEVIKATQAKLLTFKNLAATADEVGGSMDRATMAALDLAAAGFGSAETNAVQLGKALQDPIKGITALARAGVTFTQVEKDKIRALVESGNVLEAQNLILSAIETQVGGTAQATAKASDKIKLAFDNISESVGEALLPVFNDFANELTKITPELEAALAPAAQEVAQIFRDQVLPAISNFTQWLASPQGTKTIKDLTQSVVDGIKAFIDFAAFIIRNREAIGLLITSVVAFTAAVKISTTATALYGAAMQLMAAKAAGAAASTTTLGTALRLLPWAAAIAGASLFVSTMSDYADEVYGSKVNTDGLTEAQAAQFRKVEGLQRLLKQYEYALENGTEANKDLAREGIARVNSQLREMGLTTKEVNAIMNGTSLAKYRSQLGDTRIDALRLVNAQKQLYYAMRGLPMPTLPCVEEDRGGGGGGGGGRSGPTAFEQTQKIIKDAQKKLAEAAKRYNEAVSSANKAYNKTIADANKAYGQAITDAETRKTQGLADALKEHNRNIASIQSDFAKRQADIITQSINRLRDAYAQAVRTNVADLFGTEQVAKSVDTLITTLRDRLTASRQLVQNAALLASQGFSQTFIEQVVGAGLETGNELSKAILEATPETQRELASLFGALESESETGMDSLARTMFEKTGLATTELKKLFTQTQTDLVTALAQAQVDYTTAQEAVLKSFDDAMLQAQSMRDEAFSAANERLNEALTEARDQYVETVNEIKEAFLEQIAALENGLGGLKRTVDQLLALMNQLAGQGAPKIGTLPSVPTNNTPTPVPIITPLPLTSQKPTIVNNTNITVKTDPTKSVSQTGAAVAKALNRYTGGGGGLNRGFVAV